MYVYLIGSLRNPRVPEIAKAIRAETGFDVFDDWYAAGPEADDYWQRYEKARGHTYSQALEGNPAWHVFNYDKSHLDRADVGVLIMPAGRSGHMELGYLIGRERPTFILLTHEPGPDERWDVMYRFANDVLTEEKELIVRLKNCAIPQHTTYIDLKGKPPFPTITIKPEDIWKPIPDNMTAPATPYVYAASSGVCPVCQQPMHDGDCR